MHWVDAALVFGTGGLIIFLVGYVMGRRAGQRAERDWTIRPR